MNTFSILSGIYSVVLTGLKLAWTPMPKPTSTLERLKVIESLPKPPFQGKVDIYWNDYQVPFVHAEHSLDAAYALGITHAHLRLAQMELGKRLALGRLSEIAGPIMHEVDQTLRAVNYGKASDEVLANMPEDVKQWLTHFCDGINHYKAHTASVPHELKALNVDNEPWQLSDCVALARLGGTDVNWLVYLTLLPLTQHEHWPQLWHKLKHVERWGAQELDAVTFDLKISHKKHKRRLQKLARILSHYTRSGSNSYAISGQKSQSGFPMIASDPHLSIMLPNLWLICGIKCPDFHTVGMMAPGIPVFGFGRNPDLAWGGTNLRSWSSDLIDLDKFPEEQLKQREEHTKTRFGFKKTLKITESPYGPVLSDLKLIAKHVHKKLALNWMGHQASDEITALYRAAKSTDHHELLDAFKTFSVPGQNFIFATKSGNIGHTFATWVNKHNTEFPHKLWLDFEEHEKYRKEIFNCSDFPSRINPAEGFVASANNRPPVNSEIPIGWFFSSEERIQRIHDLLAKKDIIGISDLIRIQQDCFSHMSVLLTHVIAQFTKEFKFSRRQRIALDMIQEWDGFYDVESHGAYIFEAFLAKFAPSFYRAIDRKEEYELWRGSGFLHSQLIKEIQHASDVILYKTIVPALDYAYEKSLDRKTWGDIHHIFIENMLSQIPLFGRRYHLKTLSVSGSRQTVMKSSHDLTIKKHPTDYGSQARHISDLGDLNANYFVLLGGQDGWINSTNYYDQLSLWKEGRYIQIPLEIEKLKKHFRHVNRFS